MNEHTGFHEYKDGRRFNPECLVCLAEERDYRLNEYIIKMMSLQAEVKRRIESGRLSAMDYE